DGAASLSVTDRATIANMSPEYGATMGFFPIDEKTCDYYLATGRSDEQIQLIRSYFTAQGMFGVPREGECNYSTLLQLDLSTVEPSVSGPKRPQDRIALPDLKSKFVELLQKPLSENGYNKSRDEIGQRFPARVGARYPGPLAGGGDQQSETAPVAAHNS